MEDTGIVIVNWNGWPDTLECLEAVFRMHEFNGPVVVCDNASSDNSLAYIQAWAAGRLCSLAESNDPAINKLVTPPIEKPISVAVIAPGDDDAARVARTEKTRLWLVPVGSNAGFAGGNNVGLKLLLELSGIQFFWLLNNDAVPDRDAFRQLRAAAVKRIGPLICGSVLMEYSKPNDIQAVGAYINYLLIYIKHLGAGKSIGYLDELPDEIGVSYPIGASILVNRRFLKDIGLMSEEYFLYFEEIDWVIRGRHVSSPFVVNKSRVFHKGGKSINNAKASKSKSGIHDFYWMRGRIIISRKISVLSLFISIILSILALVKRALFRAGSFKIALRGFLDGLCYIVGKNSRRKLN